MDLRFRATISGGKYIITAYKNIFEKDSNVAVHI